MKKVRNSQASISINSCTEFSETRFFPVSIIESVLKFFVKDFGKNLQQSLFLVLLQARSYKRCRN